MRALISYADLDRLAGEILPERTLLSTVSDVAGWSPVGDAGPGSAVGNMTSDAAGATDGDMTGGGLPGDAISGSAVGNVASDAAGGPTGDTISGAASGGTAHSVGQAVTGDSAGDVLGDPAGDGALAGEVADTSAADVVGSNSDDGDSAQPHSTPSHPVDNNDDGSTVYYTCQTTHKQGTPGLMGSLGLGSNNPSTTQTCTPSAAQN